MSSLWENPLELDGIDFVEFSDSENGDLSSVFKSFGFAKVGNHKTKKIELWRQGDINFLINREDQGFAFEFRKLHGPSVCSMGFRCKDAVKTSSLAVERGAKSYLEESKKTFETPLPSIFGIGDSLIYFVDTYSKENNLFDREFNFTQDKNPRGYGFRRVDHLTNNVPAGHMEKWVSWYSDIFNFKEKRYFDIRGSKTGLESKVMVSPCGKIIIPVNEPSDEKSQIQEYLNEYKGAGVQHIALLTNDIFSSMRSVKTSAVEFLSVPGTYYEAIPERLPNVEENPKVLEELGLLVDGDEDGYLLQIFTQNLCGPIFFEVIQRKNHDGFGEGNFTALFEAIERDQERRGFI